jgi:putative ABC transport system ATP-binding protein
MIDHQYESPAGLDQRATPDDGAEPRRSAGALLRGSQLSRSFGDADTRILALDGVSLEVTGGEMALLMGPSGSGKTTLLAVLSGLLRPDSGQVLAGGEDIWAMSEEQRERFRLKHCGFIFQGYNLFTALTARQQMEMVVRWGEGASYREARRRADAMLKLLDLTRKANLRPIQLSGGEKQRVAIGRALIKEPTFLFADEPTSALDWAHGEQVVDLLRNAAHERGAAVIIVSHDPRIIPYADHVFHLEDGRLVPGGEQVIGHHHPPGKPGNNGNRSPISKG